MQYPNIAQPQYGFAPTMPMMGNGGSVADAQSVQSKGRGRDTMLVHMTPKEVGGLQALAMQHGGSLTINPQTGLPEAGFLENMLPTLLGVGLSFIPGVGPLAAAGITTAIQTARTGDLGQGLIAGLGAYGGASLGSGVMSAGTAAEASNLASAGTADALTAAGTNALEASAPALTPTQQFTTGAQNLFSSGQSGDAARTAFMGKVGGASGLASDVGMAASPALFEQPDYSVPLPKVEESNYAGPYTPSDRGVRFPNEEERRRTSEFSFFGNTNPVPFAEGGSVGGRTVGMPQPDMYGDMLSRMNENYLSDNYLSNCDKRVQKLIRLLAPIWIILFPFHVLSEQSYLQICIRSSCSCEKNIQDACVALVFLRFEMLSHNFFQLIWDRSSLFDY